MVPMYFLIDSYGTHRKKGEPRHRPTRGPSMHNRPRRNWHSKRSATSAIPRQPCAAEILEGRILLSGSAPVLSAAGITPNQILLQWTAAATPALDIGVERRQGDLPFATVATLPADAIS